MRGHRQTAAVAAMAAAIIGATSPVGRAQMRPPAATSSGSPRGIYLSGASLGVSAEIELDRGGQRGMVPPTYEFKSGDKFWLHITTNKDAYVYVLNRTVVGDPAGAASRGIKVMQQQDRARPVTDAYTLVYPTAGSAPTRVRANVTTRLPGGSQYLMMDEVVGAEKLIIVATDSPSGITKYFDPDTGKLARSTNSADSSANVLDRLNTDLATLADNGTTEEPARSRDIVIKPLPGQKPVADNRATPPPPPPPPPPRGRGQSASTTHGPRPEAGRTSIVVRKNPEQGLLQELTLVHVAR